MFCIDRTTFQEVSYWKKTVVLIAHHFCTRVSSFTDGATRWDALFVLELVHQRSERFEYLQTERWVDKVVTERNVGATPESVRYNARLACVLPQKMSDSFDNFVLENTLLNLGELEDDWNKAS